MPTFIYAIDTNIAFTKKVYYIKFKDQEIKYVRNHHKGHQDDLILKVNGHMTPEKAFSLVTELLSSLSYSWDAYFDIHSSFSMHHGAFVPWERITNSAAGKRKIRASESRDDFIFIHPLNDDNQVMLARLYRLAMISHPIYFKILSLWHCLTYPNTDEEKIAQELNVNCTDDTKNILEHPILYKKNEKIGIGDYIYRCVRNSIAHIIRKPKTTGKNLTLSSLEELNHLSAVSDLMRTLAREKMKNEYNMCLADDRKYLSYFTPKK